MTNPKTGSEIRASFLQHYKDRGHTVLPSSSLVPDNDPTLMFTNSGMVQFKNNLSGADTRLKRATTVQKSVRLGGKHNDLENIGFTARHHTFFEMLGNFSFGDYFKEEAITWAWEWVTETLKLDPSRLCVTIYQDDDEAFDLWNKKIGLAKKDIIRLGDKSNFWTMGDTGPCGPSSEIFYDLDPSGKTWGGRPGTPEEDGDRFVEIWNLVFTQFDLHKDGTKVPLKQKNIDTGAGLERVMCATQGVSSNYDTDLFQALLQPISKKILGAEYNSQFENSASLRVIADHLRTMTFLMVEGVMPSNEGRGYVLRRVMRRAMRHGFILGMEKPFIYDFVPLLVHTMGEAYPELGRGASMAMDVIKMEEERFGRTLKQGLGLLDDATKGLTNGAKLDGAVAFKLYDTFGFPLDLTQDALRARNVEVDIAGFDTAMAEQKARARASHKGSGDSKLADVWFDVQDKVGKTEFLGYTTLEAEAVVTALVKDAHVVNDATEGDEVFLVVNQTPFYAESGGQAGDTGDISGNGWSGRVMDTQKVLDGLWVHKMKVLEGTAKVGDTILMAVSKGRRLAITRNHTATHLLFAGLRDILGNHVVQRGSYQDETGTRFDFSHPKSLSKDEISKLEEWVNLRIWANLPILTQVLNKDDALKTGATAQFGEKYGDDVRVVSIGQKINQSPISEQRGLGLRRYEVVTADLCGGTHVAQTGEIGLFRITGEGSVAAGIRRIEGVTHRLALESFKHDAGLIKDAAAHLKVKPEGVLERIADLQAKGKQAAKAASPALDVAALAAKVETVNGLPAVLAEVGASDAEQLRVAVEGIKAKLGSVVVLLVSQTEGKTSLVAGVTKDLTVKVQAGPLVNAAAAVLGGKGGGKPELAMAGGGAGDVGAALAAARNMIKG